MPKRDGTGPKGQGSRTGAKMGKCEGSKNIPFNEGKGNQGCGGHKGEGNRWSTDQRGKNKMRIIKPVLENDEKAGIAENAARAPFFVVFDDDKFVKSIKNPFVTGGGAGFAVADLLYNEGCDKFIAKKLGDNMKSALDSHNIIYELID